MQAISIADLSSCLAQATPPVLIDVRRESARQASGMGLATSIWRDPAHWLDWKNEVAALPGPVVFFCAHGQEISQGLCAALRAMGKDARYLQGGFAQWKEAKLPVTAITAAATIG